MSPGRREPEEGEPLSTVAVMNELRNAVFELYAAADRLEQAIAEKTKTDDGGDDA